MNTQYSSTVQYLLYCTVFYIIYYSGRHCEDLLEDPALVLQVSVLLALQHVHFGVVLECAACRSAEFTNFLRYLQSVNIHGSMVSSSTPQ